MRICSVIIYPLKKKFIGTSSILAGGKSRVLPADPLFTNCIMPGSNWNSSDFPFSRSARPPIRLSFEYNLQCPLLVSQLFPPLLRMFQWLWLLPYLNILFVQASDISSSLPKSENVRDVCLDCFDLICHLQTPASRARAYCDCNPIRAFETFDISKEPISKTSRFWMFWYKRGCNWLGAIKGMALWSRGFSRGSLFKTRPKPETAHEKPLEPRITRGRQSHSILIFCFDILNLELFDFQMIITMEFM